MIASIRTLDVDPSLSQEQYDNLCAVVLEQLDELDVESAEFYTAVAAGPRSLLKFLQNSPCWTRVVRDLVRLMLHDLNTDLLEHELAREANE